MVMEITKTTTGLASLVFTFNNERVVHRFVDGGSIVESVLFVGGQTYGSPTFFHVKHGNEATPQDVLNFLNLGHVTK